jgi:hypothetical protein
MRPKRLLRCNGATTTTRLPTERNGELSCAGPRERPARIPTTSVFTRNILRRPPRRNTSQNRRLRISPEFPIFLRFLLCSRNIIVGRRKQGRVSWLRLVALRRARLSIQDERRVRGAAGDRPHRAAIPMCVDLFLPPFVLRFVSKFPVVKIAAFPWNPEKYRWAELSFEISTRRFLSSSRNLLRCHLISIFSLGSFSSYLCDRTFNLPLFVNFPVLAFSESCSRVEEADLVWVAPVE